MISHRSEYPVLESALWKIPAVSITSSMFFRDSGMASNYTTNSRGSPSEERTETVSTGERRHQPSVGHISYNHMTVLDVSRKTILTSRSLDPACMYLSMKSRMVSQRAAKVGRDSRGERCWRKTWSNGEQDHMISPQLLPGDRAHVLHIIEMRTCSR